MGETREKEGGSVSSSGTASKSVSNNEKPERRGSEDNETDAKKKGSNESNAKGDSGDANSDARGSEPAAEKSGTAPDVGVSREQSAGAKSVTSNEEAYEKVKKTLRDLMAKKADIDRELEDIEERLYVEEGTYLQDASAGNVAKGFEHYTKGSQNRRKSLLGDQDRVFSQSSTSFEAES